MITSWLCPYLSYQYYHAVVEEIEKVLKEKGYDPDAARKLMDEGRMTIYTVTDHSLLNQTVSAEIDGNEIFTMAVSFSESDGPKCKLI